MYPGSLAHHPIPARPSASPSHSVCSQPRPRRTLVLQAAAPRRLSHRPVTRRAVTRLTLHGRPAAAHFCPPLPPRPPSAQLSSAHLTPAHHSSPRLSSAHITSPHLSSAQLSSAQLNSAQFNSVKLSSVQLNSPLWMLPTCVYSLLQKYRKLYGPGHWAPGPYSLRDVGPETQLGVTPRL